MNIEQFISDLITRMGFVNSEATKQFLRDWIRHERRAKGKPHGFNPLNTTYNLSADKGATNFNYANVKNYSTYAYGLEATAKTLGLRYYRDLVNYLKGIQTTPEKVSANIRIWGTIPFANSISKPTTGANANKVYKPYPLPIIALAVLLIALFFIYPLLTQSNYYV